jgi:hypothetical protein
MSSPITIYNNIVKIGLPFPVQEYLKDEYFKFLALKVYTEDLDGAIISPSLEVDQIWHTHLLYNKHYLDMCININFIIYHYPERENDNELTKIVRRNNFTDLCNYHFPSVKPKIPQKICIVKCLNSDNDLIPVFIKTITGNTKTIYIDLDKETLSTFKQKVLNKENIMIEHQRYLFHGKILDNNDKLLKDYGIEKNSILHLLLQLRGC